MIIGITGNIGSGKSTFSRILSSMLDWKLVDLDVKAKTICFEYREDIEEICRKYGFRKNKENYLQFLKRNFFQNEELYKEIHSFVRPKINISNFQHTILESAILFEEKLNEECDFIISIVVSDNVRYERLQKTRGMSREEVDKILQKQTHEQIYSIDKADLMIDNSGDEYYLLLKAEETMSFIYKNFQEKL